MFQQLNGIIPKSKTEDSERTPNTCQSFIIINDYPTSRILDRPIIEVLKNLHVLLCRHTKLRTSCNNIHEIEINFMFTKWNWILRPGIQVSGVIIWIVQYIFTHIRRQRIGTCLDRPSIVGFMYQWRSYPSVLISLRMKFELCLAEAILWYLFEKLNIY